MQELDTKELQTAIDKFKTVETQVTEIADNQSKTVEAIDDLKNEVANLAAKPTQHFETKSTEQIIEEADFAKLFLEYGQQPQEVKQLGFEAFAAKTLNINPTDPKFPNQGEEGANAIAEVLDRNILKRARDEVAIIGEVGSRPISRMTRRLVTISFPSVEPGFENFDLSKDWDVSDTPTTGQIRNHIFKRHAKYPITDEAMVGTDINLWSDLLYEVQITENQWLERSILFGNGSDLPNLRTMRGILSSARLDVKDGGEAWKPTYKTSSSEARDLDHFAAKLTGADAKFGADDKSTINFLIDLMTMLKPVYRRSGKFYMHDDTLQELKKVRDGIDRPIFTDYQDGSIRIFGKQVVTSDYWPKLGQDMPAIAFGDLSQAINVTNGDVNKTILDEYTVDGVVQLRKSMEYFEMVEKNDAIVFGICAKNKPAQNPGDLDPTQRAALAKATAAKAK